MEVREIGSDELAMWDEFVDRTAQGTAFQKKEWLQLCNIHSGMRFKIYGCYDDGNLVGGCSGFVDRVGLMKHTYSSVKPFTRYGSLLLAEPGSRSVRSHEKWASDIIRAITGAMEKDGYQQITITHSPGFKDVRPFTWLGWVSRVYYTYVLDLANLSTDSFEKTARWCIKKGVKNRYVVKKKSDPQVHFSLFEGMLKGKGIKPNISLQVFRDVLGGNGRKAACEMWVAESPEGEIVSSQIITVDSKMAYLWSEATRPEHRGQGANCLLQYEVQQEMARRGYRYMDLTRANVPQLSSYASQLNPELVPYYMVERPSRPYRSVNWAVKAIGL